MKLALQHLWHRHGSILWRGGLCGMLGVAPFLAGCTTAEIVGKLYAFLAAALAAVPFFREANLKQALDTVREIPVEDAEQRDLREKSTRALEARIAVFYAKAHPWMRRAIMAATAAVGVDLGVILCR